MGFFYKIGANNLVIVTITVLELSQIQQFLTPFPLLLSFLLYLVNRLWGTHLTPTPHSEITKYMDGPLWSFMFRNTYTVRLNFAENDTCSTDELRGGGCQKSRKNCQRCLWMVSFVFLFMFWAKDVQSKDIKQTLHCFILVLINETMHKSWSKYFCHPP